MHYFKSMIIFLGWHVSCYLFFCAGGGGGGEGTGGDIFGVGRLLMKRRAFGFMFGEHVELKSFIRIP